MLQEDSRPPGESQVPPNIDEGGLRAPPDLSGWRKAWWWFDFLILVKLARLRFIAVLGVIGLVITQWELLLAYYDKWTRPATADAGPMSGDVEWFCPMHPAVVRDNPRDKCPVCFMPLSKRKKGASQDEALPAGIVSRVQLSPYRVVLAGVQTIQADYQPLTKQIDAVGYIEFDERGQRTVSARINGRIDKLYVNETGQMVEEGTDLALLYSPEMIVSEQNLLDARRRTNNADFSGAARRLELLGVSRDQVDEILQTGKVSTDIKVRSPIAGHVIKKYVREGQYVQEGMPLYELADLSTVWIQGQVYEDDLEFLPVDHIHKSSQADCLPVVATTRAFPDQPFYGTLAFVYPHVDQETRTITVRFEVANPDHHLRPGSTATVMIQVPIKQLPMFEPVAAAGGEGQQMLEAGRVLAVPEAAVIDTGSQKIVYRETLPGVFEGVRVQLGPRMTGPHNGNWFPVLSGLNKGDAIVASGSFLVDAETRLNPAAGSIYFGGSGGAKGSAGVTGVRPSTPEDEESKLAAVLTKLPPEDRRLVAEQGCCPVLTDNKLGSMGVPLKVMVAGQPVFVCCGGCRKEALDHPQKTLAKVAELKRRQTAPAEKPAEAPIDKAADKPSAAQPSPPPVGGKHDKIAAALARLSEADRKLAEQQRFCAVLGDSRLGSMGPPVKLLIDGQAVFVCCQGCREEALANPKATLSKAESLRKAADAGK